MNKLILSADQIYALAYILKAKYLDYYYISLASHGINHNLWLTSITKELVSKGVLTEDFSGETELVSDYDALVKPLYFGKKESSLDINVLGENESNVGYRFHFLDGNTIMTKLVDGMFEISEVSAEDIRKIVMSILPADYSALSAKTEISLDTNKITRVFVVKNAEIAVKSYVTTFVEMEGSVYEEDTENILYTVSGSDFINKINKAIVEV